MPPIVLVLSFIAAVAVTGLLRLAGGTRPLADLGIAIGFLLGYALLFGELPSWRGSVQLVAAAALVGAVLGVLLAVLHAGRNLVGVVAVLVPVAIIALMAWPSLQRLDAPTLILVAALVLVGIALFARMAARGSGPEPAAMLMVAALGLAGVAWASGSLSFMRLSLVLAAALLGFLAWAWPVRVGFGAAGLLAGGAAFFAMAARLALQGSWRLLVPLAVLALVFWADRVVGRARVPLVLVAAAVPALAATALAWLLAGRF